MALTDTQQELAYIHLLCLKDSLTSLESLPISREQTVYLKSIVREINALQEALCPDHYKPTPLTVNINMNPSYGNNRLKNLSWFDTILLGLAEGFEQEAREKAEKKRRRKERINKFLRRK
ncbi:hypothetical protein [Bacillus phage SBSphiJ3]|nr:hypothetical protein [Bacillus phage SBSphiJ1]UPI11996.1 hypothetical protein [Bacillus phage SBSphiJ2]UPI12252.1 hypothetical protein [Bacillus phage SBSphiJ3]UPI12502.1 hypothetical protein [Bacillus phage SBSphiJ4]